MDSKKVRAYAVKWINSARENSASGGLFPAVAKCVIEKKKDTYADVF